MTDVVGLLDEADRELAPLERDVCLAEWDVATRAGEDTEKVFVERSLALDAALSDEDRYAALRAASADGDPLVARRLQVLRAEAEAHQRPPDLAERIVRLEAALQTLFNGHRGLIGGRAVSDNEITEVLRDSTDTDLRREAWEASKSIGPLVAPKIRELAHLRNEAARALGYRDHFAMSLALTELDEGWLFGFLDRLAERTGASWAREKEAIDVEQRARLGLPEGVPLRPWDMADPFFQEVPPIQGDDLNERLAALDPLPPVRSYFSDLGDDVEAVLELSDLYPRDRKSQHAFCLQVDRLDDIRVLANIVPGERWLGTMLHELGHAEYDLAINRALPWGLRRPSHIFTTEAIAILHGRQNRKAAFLSRYAGLGEGADDPVHERVIRRERHVFTAWVQVMTRFERALYANPDGDLGAEWWSLVARHQRVTPPDASRPDDWASKIHLALAPVYYQNYLLGEATAVQLEAAIERLTGSRSPASNPAEAGAFLRDRFMRAGASMRWDALVEHATGEPLSPDHLAARMEG
jgi:peptidyl-dipeptidase A